jgi:hypothetical protein
MKVKVFQSNHNGKIEFTRTELEKLLNEVYTDGYNEGKSSNWTWTSPSISTTPYYNTITTCDTKTDKSINDLTCTNTSVKSTVDDGIATCAATSAAKSSKPSTYTIDLGKCDFETLSKAVNEIVFNAHKPVWDQATREDNDPIANLTKELNF